MEGIFQSKWFWFLGILFVLSPLIVVFGIVWIPKLLTLVQSKITPPAAPPIETAFDESKSPIAFDILQNPMVYEWRGSVEGVLVEKTDNSITLDSSGSRLVITVQPSSQGITGTKFYRKQSQPDDQGVLFTEVGLDDIPLGTKLHGDFFVFPHQKNELVGSSFNIVE